MLFSQAITILGAGLAFEWNRIRLEPVEVAEMGELITAHHRHIYLRQAPVNEALDFISGAA
jgi:hypothetical protein